MYKDMLPYQKKISCIHVYIQTYKHNLLVNISQIGGNYIADVSILVGIV